MLENFRDPSPKLDRRAIEGLSSPLEESIGETDVQGFPFPELASFDIETTIEALRIRDGLGERKSSLQNVTRQLDGDIIGRYGEEVHTSLLELCEARAADFRLLGVVGVTGEDIWHTVLRRHEDIPPLYRLVADILSLKVQAFLDDRRRETYRGLR